MTDIDKLKALADQWEDLAGPSKGKWAIMVREFIADLRARIAGGVEVELWLSDKNKNVGRYCVLTDDEYAALLPWQDQHVTVILSGPDKGDDEAVK